MLSTQCQMHVPEAITLRSPSVAVFVESGNLACDIGIEGIAIDHSANMAVELVFRFRCHSGEVVEHRTIIGPEDLWPQRQVNMVKHAVAVNPSDCVRLEAVLDSRRSFRLHAADQTQIEGRLKMFGVEFVVALEHDSMLVFTGLWPSRVTIAPAIEGLLESERLYVQAKEPPVRWFGRTVSRLPHPRWASAEPGSHWLEIVAPALVLADSLEASSHVKLLPA